MIFLIYAALKRYAVLPVTLTFLIYIKIPENKKYRHHAFCYFISVNLQCHYKIKSLILNCYLVYPKETIYSERI